MSLLTGTIGTRKATVATITEGAIMAWKKYKPGKIYHPWKDMEIGYVFEGKYRGRSYSKFSKPGKNQDNFMFEDDDGKDHVFNYCGKLNHAFGEDGKFPPGTYCRLEYLGKIMLNSGDYAGTQAHDFDIDTDPERSDIGTDMAGGQDGFGSTSYAPEDDPVNYPSEDEFDAGSLM